MPTDQYVAKLHLEAPARLLNEVIHPHSFLWMIQTTNYPHNQHLNESKECICVFFCPLSIADLNFRLWFWFSLFTWLWNAFLRMCVCLKKRHYGPVMFVRSLSTCSFTLPPPPFPIIPRPRSFLFISKHPSSPRYKYQPLGSILSSLYFLLTKFYFFCGLARKNARRTPGKYKIYLTDSVNSKIVMPLQSSVSYTL